MKTSKQATSNCRVALYAEYLRFEEKRHVFLSNSYFSDQCFSQKIELRQKRNHKVASHRWNVVFFSMITLFLRVIRYKKNPVCIVCQQVPLSHPFHSLLFELFSHWCNKPEATSHKLWMPAGHCEHGGIFGILSEEKWELGCQYKHQHQHQTFTANIHYEREILKAYLILT